MENMHKRSRFKYIAHVQVSVVGVSFYSAFHNSIVINFYPLVHLCMILFHIVLAPYVQ